jgi:hypothetical protein
MTHDPPHGVASVLMTRLMVSSRVWAYVALFVDHPVYKDSACVPKTAS